jgi:predicted N-acetyltransferase YhbS
MTQTQLSQRPLAALAATQSKEDKLAHALDFELLVEDRLATEHTPYRCGTALFRRDLPRVAALNVLRVESGVEALDAAALIEFADGLQTGLPQRSLRVVDDQLAAQLRPVFAAAGWITAGMTLMAPRRRPDRPIDTTSVHAVELETIAYARQATLGRAYRDLDTAEQLLVAGEMPALGTEVRAFASTVGNEVAAYAVARVAGHVAKLTEVDALVRSHGHGLGRALIWGAVKELRAEGVRLVVVEAQDDAWTRWIYLRLGFEDIGRTHRFVRAWGDEPAAPPAI